MKRGVEVATLEDSLNAKWADSNPSMRNGTRLKTGSELLLIREGFATLVFDNDTRVVIEGPAEFQVLTGDQIKLNYGRIYAIVPPQAYGFQVTTPGTKIIDLGTEFGVQQDRHGNTELHVISGKTSLVAGIRGSRINAYVEAGSAKRLDTSIGQIKEIACDETLFVRRIDSQVNLVWRGEQTLDLADMVRNGNGLGTGNSKVRLNPFKGFTNEQHNDKRGFHYATAKEYLSITDHPFIDGIFIPNGDPNQIINSRGDVFDECPKTSGIFDRDLQANPEPGIFRLGRREGTIRFDGQEYSDQSGRSCIVMHANHGLTFDLDAIRKSYHRDINRFTSRIGIADLNEIYPCNADFYVLVDGKIRYSLKQYKQKGVLNDVSVEIKKTDRFLTLVVTDGGDPDVPDGDLSQRAITCDWGVFTDPILALE
jgi:hypothetical protein